MLDYRPSENASDSSLLLAHMVFLRRLLISTGQNNSLDRSKIVELATEAMGECNDPDYGREGREAAGIIQAMIEETLGYQSMQAMH